MKHWTPARRYKDRALQFNEDIETILLKLNVAAHTARYNAATGPTVSRQHWRELTTLLQELAEKLRKQTSPF